MSDDGRFYVTDFKIGRKFCVECIDDFKRPADWGDLNPSTRKLEGSYGSKHIGAITEEESIIKKENGFKNIVILENGKNPINYIEQLLKQKK